MAVEVTQLDGLHSIFEVPVHSENVFSEIYCLGVQDGADFEPLEVSLACHGSILSLNGAQHTSGT